MGDYGDPDYDEIDQLIDTDPIALGRRCRKAEAALERLRSCSHACVPPCPHSRKFDEVTREVLPPRRVKPYPADTGRRAGYGRD